MWMWKRTQAVAEKPLKKKQKRSKKSDKKKDGTSSSSSQHPHESSTGATTRSTATEEGRTMAQVLSTFHRMELSRFEAFRRSTFCSDTISTYISHCLAVQEERTLTRTKQAHELLRTRTRTRTRTTSSDAVHVNPNHARALQQRHQYSHPSSEQTQQQSLNDMVTPGQAEEIVAVVSTCAKLYAQRLVTAARRVATYAEGKSEEEALSPHHVVQAYQARVKAGVDPGFFLSATRSGGADKGGMGGELSTTYQQDAVSAAALGTTNRSELQRNAALAAQEAYDQYMLDQQKQQQDEAEATNADAMQVDEVHSVGDDTTTTN